MKRREFIASVGAMVAWLVAARAQPMPVVGFLSSRSRGESGHLTAAFREGLNDTGYIEGRNVLIEYRWAESQFDRLPELVANLLQHKAAVLFAFTNVSALAAKASKVTVPVVFLVGEDPVALGLLSSPWRSSELTHLCSREWSQ